MIMKSIFTVSCFVVMALAIGTNEWEIPPMKVFNLIEDMNATCKSLKNESRQRVKEVDFTAVNCEKEAYRNTFCQINRALLSFKDYNVSRALSYFHDNKCTSMRSFIRLKYFCSQMLKYIQNFYGKCVERKKKID